jgi:hypothetical protein
MRSSSSTCTHIGSADAAFPFSNEAAEGPEPRSNICRSEPERCVSRGTGEAKRKQRVSAVAWHLCVVHAERRTYGGRAGHARRAQSRGRATVYVPAIIFTMRFPSAVTLPSARGETDPSPVSHGSPRCWNDGSPWPMGMGERGRARRGLDASACAGRPAGK